MKNFLISRLLRPQSIATFGGSWSASIVAQCQKMGFSGQIWPVHPERDEIGGMRCYRRLEDLPSAPDASFIGVNRDATIELVHQLAARGGGGAVCFASGFREVDDGQARHEALLQAAGTMPILGPNCYGFINYLDGALLWPDQHGGKRVKSGVAIITQSSNIAINLTMQKRALPIAYMLTAGNQAQIGVADLGLALLADERVSAIGLHIEGFDDIGAMEQLFRDAAARHIPIVALKVGRSAQAQKMALSHTASLAGADRLVDRFFARYGVARVDDLDDFLETLKLLHLIKPLADKTVASMSCSGGEASLVGDLASKLDIDLRPLSEVESKKIAATLPPLVTISNPLDYHTFSWGNEQALTATFSVVLECGYGMTILVLDFPRADRCHDHGAEISMAAAIQAVCQLKASGREARLAVVASLPENMSETLADELIAAGIAPLMGLRSALVAIAHAAMIGTSWRAAAVPPLNLPSYLHQSTPSSITALDEGQAKIILRQIGIPTPLGDVATTQEAAVEIAKDIGFPVVVKGVGNHLLHKTEQAAIKLNIKDATGVKEAVQQLEALNCHFWVEKMIEGGIAELLIGIARDPQFGLYLTLGMGGVLVELWQDVRQLLLPVSRDEIRQALFSLKLAPLLQGFRGALPANIEAIIDVVEKVALLALDETQMLEELDINPLIVTGNLALAADALIIRRNS